MAKTEEAKVRSKAASAGKKRVRKKPKDKPKRPLSAYNYFFKQERQRILKYLLRNPDDVIEDAVVDDDEEKRLWTTGKKISFEEMGKLIGKRWKNIEGNQLEKYTSLASSDAERYQKELKVWNEKKEDEKQQAAAELSLKNSQVMAMQSGGLGGPGFGLPNAEYHYNPSMLANAQSYNIANSAVYPHQNDPNTMASFGQQMAMGQLGYNPYQAQKNNQLGNLNPYGNSSNENDMPQAYGGYGGAESSIQNGVPYNSHMASAAAPGPNPNMAQHGTAMPDAGNGLPNYYNQGGQIYGPPYQQHPNGNRNQQWG